MKDIDLFQQALGLDNGWYVVKSNFNLEKKRLDIDIDFTRGTEFLCPECSHLSKVHDTIEKTWRHLNFFQYEAYLHARVPRTKCDEHGVRMVSVPWATSGSGFTLLFEALILTLVKEMSVATVATLVGETDKKIWRVVNKHVQGNLDKQDLSGISRIGVDETSISKGHRYVTVFVNMDTKKVIYSTEGKDSTTIQRFMHQLARKGGCIENIKEFSCDMSPAYIKGIHDFFPNAKITFDKFHIIKYLNKAVDEVRKEEQRTEKILTGSKYIWLKNEKNLSIGQKQEFDKISKKRLKTVRAYHLKTVFQEIFYYGNDNGEEQVKQWYSWAIRSRLDPIKEFSRLLKSHWNGIVEYFNSGLTNAILEGTNNLIQQLKRRARGYRSTRNFITMIYFTNCDFSALPT